MHSLVIFVFRDLTPWQHPCRTESCPRRCDATGGRVCNILQKSNKRLDSQAGYRGFSQGMDILVSFPLNAKSSLPSNTFCRSFVDWLTIYLFVGLGCTKSICRVVGCIATLFYYNVGHTHIQEWRLVGGGIVSRWDLISGQPTLTALVTGAHHYATTPPSQCPKTVLEHTDVLQNVTFYHKFVYIFMVVKGDRPTIHIFYGFITDLTINSLSTLSGQGASSAIFQSSIDSYLIVDGQSSNNKNCEREICECWLR